MPNHYFVSAVMASFLVTMIACAQDDSRTFATGGVVISHDVQNEGLYFDTPAGSVAYNVQIMQIASGRGLRHATIYHSEPRNKGAGKPGDSIKLGSTDGDFTFAMPRTCEYRLWGVQDDPQSPLFSPDSVGLDGWGGAGNPVMIKGSGGDDYFYIFFLCVSDDNGDRNVHDSDWRHVVMQARTKDFVNVDIRAEVDGQVCWKPFADNVPKQWRRPKPLVDTKGEPLRNTISRKQGNTQGLIGSICRHENTYFFFYTDIDSDNKTHFFFRTSPDIATLENTWSPATRVSDEALMEGTCIRVARAAAMNQWVVLYNGYTDRQRNNRLRQGLMIQVTEDGTVTGKGGLCSLRFFDRFVADRGISDHYDLALSSGNGVFAQHDFMTDEYGNVACPSTDDAAGQRGLITWTALTPAVSGSKVYWAEFDMREQAVAE